MGINRNVKIYVLTLFLFALLLLGYFVHNIISFGLIEKYGLYNILGIILISAITESMGIYVSKDVVVSTTFAVNAMATVLYGPEIASLISIGYLLRVLKVRGRIYHIFNTSIYKTIFNFSLFVLMVGLSGVVYRLYMGSVGDIIFPKVIFGLLIFLTIFLFLNSLLIGILMSLLNKVSILTVISQDIKWGIPNLIALSVLGLLMAVVVKNWGMATLILFLGPLFAVRYAFSLYISVKNMYYETVQALMKAVEAKDSYTRGHSERVSKYVELIARELDFSETRIEKIKMAAVLHDIGKIGISEGILNKPGRLSEEEYDLIKSHPEIGYNILNEVEVLKDISYYVRYHHEKYSGGGYPTGISGKEIPVEANIIAISDVYDALTSDRPYRPAMTPERAYHIITVEEAHYYNPDVLNAFKKAFAKHRKEFEHDR